LPSTRDLQVFHGTIDVTAERWPLFFDQNERWFANHFDLEHDDAAAYLGRLGLGAPVVAVLKSDIVVRSHRSDVSIMFL